MGSWKAVNYKMPCLDPPFHMTRKYFFGGQAAWKNECITSVALDARHCQIWKDLTYLSAMPHWSLWCVETNGVWWVILWMFSKNRTQLWSKCTDHQNIWRDWRDVTWTNVRHDLQNPWERVDGLMGWWEWMVGGPNFMLVPQPKWLMQRICEKTHAEISWEIWSPASFFGMAFPTFSWHVKSEKRKPSPTSWPL